MTKHTFYILDVFAEEKYAGNQLAVVRNAGQLSDARMQRIAREFNFSETTFILSDEERDGGYDVRIFTPKGEVPFAGHPTLGTARVIQREIARKPVKEVVLNLKVGQIHVAPSYRGGESDILWMRQIQPTFGRVFDPEQISQVLNLEAQDIDSGFPGQEVSTGLPFIIVPIKTLEALRRSKINEGRYLELIEGIQAKAILLFCPETYSPENHLNVRVFAGYYGVPEDPATGSANGCLAGYLVKYRYFGKDKINIRVEQGHEVGRPSLLFLRAENKDGIINVCIGGKAVMVATGELI